MTRKVIQTVAGLAIGVVGFEALPHESDRQCDVVADTSFRICETDKHFPFLPAGEHIPHAEYETRAFAPVQFLASGVLSTSDPPTRFFTFSTSRSRWRDSE